MRVDCRESGLDCHRYRAFLDAIELPLCFVADEEDGLALCYATDEFGRRYPGDNVVEVRGNIEIRQVAA